MNLSPRQIDALKELANVGSGHAANALSKLLGGKRVATDPPRAQEGVGESQIVDGMQQDVVATLSLQGEPEGVLLIAMTEDDARDLCSQLLGKSVRHPMEGDARDALSETANIIGSAYLSAIAMMTQMKLLPSTPQLTQGDLSRMAARVAKTLGTTPTVWLNVRFAAAAMAGELWLLLSERAALALLGRLKVEG